MVCRSYLVLLPVAAAVSGCVSTRQVADVEFEPPQGDYSLVVMRPEVRVGSVTAGGLIQPRADWSEQARQSIVEALTTQQAGRGGRTLVADTRAVPGADPKLVADLERLHFAVASSIALHKYQGMELPTKRRKRLDWTLGEEAVTFGRTTGMEYALFLHAEDSIASTERAGLQVLGIAGCFIGFCAPQSGGGQLAYASLVDLRTGEVVWFNVLQTSSMLPGVRFGDLRTKEGAAQLVDRLLDRMKPGKAVRERQQ